MATTTDVLNFARSKLGTVESPPESNNQEFGIWYGFNKVPWCAIFVSWCLAQGGVGNQYRNASVAYSLDTARKQGRRTGEFRAGFVACRINSGKDWGPGHTGIVEAVHSDGTVTTIEGNTSPGDGGSQRDGGGVWHRRRAKSYWNKQCIRIDYSNVQVKPIEEDWMTSDEAKGFLIGITDRLDRLEAGMVDGSGVTLMERVRQVLRLGRGPAGAEVRAIYERTERTLETDSETASEKVARHVNEIETRKRPGGGTRDYDELELTLRNQ